jgi:hypothetical protein
LGGSDQDEIKGLVLDREGNAFVTGFSLSTDFPITSNAYEKNGEKTYKAFVSKLSNDGSKLMFSTLMTGGYLPSGIAIDSQGCPYITGRAEVIKFPEIPGSYHSPQTGGDDVYIAKFNPQGSEIIYAAIVSGDNDDYTTGIAVDSEGAAYICGYTRSLDFPTTFGAFQNEHLHGNQAGFISKLSPDGSSLIYSTLMQVLPSGISNYESVTLNDIAVDKDNRAYVTG